MSLVAVLAVIYGLKQIAQNGLGWSAGLPIVAGLAVGAAFVRRQTRLADPLIDLRLFKVPAFSVSVASNAFTGFFAFGTFLFIAQYLQLVLGLSPLQAGLWSLPSSVGVILGSSLAPKISRLVRPAFGVAGGLTLAAIGLGILTQVDEASGLPLLVTGSVVFSLGLGPVFILATDLIVGTAPPERAGAASAISETGAEFGGAMGIAVLGSIGTAVYRSQVIDAVPDGVPPAAVEAARDTLGGALSVAEQLPDHLGRGLVDAAHAAFTQGLHLTAGVGAVVAMGVAILVMTRLREVRTGSECEDQSVPEPDGAVVSGALDRVLEPAPAEC